ncbi:MAG: MBL fold metallo-hydrolase [Acidobacteriales bacterium 13_2_20CM_55_8]|jgi:glyoxylase-like metal-dependent hydrolase (beta-lactamase superfamily II)|nr:MAG: MBL fold metallo-hydrolase [Acidobacteriales bacterium 13_2_20CM_55_8]
MHRLTLGDFELTAISDGTYHLDGGAFFGVVPKVMWQRRVKADEKNLVPSGLNSVLARTGDQTVLIETGIGNKLPDRMVKIYGQPSELLNNLSAAGISPGDIDIVINTHLHFDHCGWNTVRQGDKIVATFPNAQYYVQEGEWQHARRQHERDAISYISDNYDPLIANGQMHLLKGDQDIVPGISVQVFPGHTQNMQAVIIKSGGQTACYISDLIPTTAHIDLTWVMAFDLCPLQTIDSRKRYYAQAIPEKWLTIFTHDPNVPWAYVEKADMGRLVARPPVK